MTILSHNYNGITVTQRSQDGYINLTEMAQATNKRVDNWLQNKSTQELIAEFNLESHWNSSSNPLDSTSNPLDSSGLTTALVTSKGNQGATWGHPDIAIQFAQWCSPSFALQVSRWVREWLSGNSAYGQMDEDHLERIELLAEIAKLDATISSSHAKREKKLRDLERLDERIKVKQLEIQMGDM